MVEKAPEKESVSKGKARARRLRAVAKGAGTKDGKTGDETRNSQTLSDAELAAKALADGLGAQLESVKNDPALPSSANGDAEPIADPVLGEGQHRTNPETLDKTGEPLAAQNRAETAAD